MQGAGIPKATPPRTHSVLPGPPPGYLSLPIVIYNEAQSMDGPMNNISREASGDHRQRRTRVLLVA